MFERPIHMGSIVEAAAALSQLPGFAWLDSARGGDVSLLAWEPTKVVSFRDFSDAARFRDFAESLKPGLPASDERPFAGGWIGFLAYESYAFNPLIPFRPTLLPGHPLAMFGYYDQCLLIDHRGKTARFLCAASDAAEKFERLKRTLADNPEIKTTNPAPDATLEMGVSREHYAQAIRTIQAALARGDYFELNYTVGFDGAYRGDPLALYARLRDVAPAPMMAYLDYGSWQILSASPELFFKADGRHVETEPIKGTVTRGITSGEDESNKARLLASDKDQAELLMVTDMLRSDLGRVCEPGTVRVTGLKEIRSFAHYHHLLSRISGTLKPRTSFFDIFCALFPGGSITGAPKIQVMRHIDALENRARGVYTGAIGYVSDNGHMQFNIPIRTAIAASGRLAFATGGGIVADSLWEAEYEECLTKAQGLLAALKAC